MSMKKKLLALGLVVVMLASLTACGSSVSGSGTVTVNFMYGGSLSIAERYMMLAEEFNKTAGKEANIKVQPIPKSSGLLSVLSQQLPTKNGPDVFITEDEFFKRYTKYMDDMTGKIDQAVLDDYYAGSLSRYHYNYETTTSTDEDPLYGITVYDNPTMLYYNRSVLKEVGVICISVEEEDLAAFNAGTGKDANGKTKADYGITSKVPAKGFYRSIAPYVPQEGETDGSSWSAPIKGEELVFNDRIAMNWDEIEDLGMLCTKSKNPDSPSDYGYYTEWWFNYGWSVGGDCIEDLSGNGDWTMSLAGDIANYIVEEGKTYTGLYTGTTYSAGDTLDIKDVINANKDDKISYTTENGTDFYYTVNGTKASERNFSQEIASGTLTELPSIREAFSRFCYLAGVGGLNVCPYPDVFQGEDSANYFASGELALLVGTFGYREAIERVIEDDWDVAPLPRYKTYTDPTDPNCDTVEKQGKIASHTRGHAAHVSINSQAKDAAYTFVTWLATEGQKFLAEQGLLSSRKSDAEVVLEHLPYKNGQVVMDSLANSKAGDWWYMPDKSWIDTWANPLNKEVRYGKKTLDDFLFAYIDETNKRLKEYKQ